jgi:hypothetical protein
MLEKWKAWMNEAKYSVWQYDSFYREESIIQWEIWYIFSTYESG